ncbi:hypothetical protein M1615_03240 [Patescibacteria group bacterium]|nr:hypothetical protein [Patescibacteria group bacterium]
MVNQELLDYINYQLGQGISREQIKSSLAVNGWQENDIDEAFAVFSNNSASSPQSAISPPALKKLPGVTAILQQAWELYKKRFWTFLGIMIIPLLVFVGLAAVAVAGGVLGIMLIFSKILAGGIGFLILLAIVYILVFSISQAWGQTALLYAIKDSQEGIGVTRAYGRGRRKIFSYWWITFLTGFITAGGYLLLVVPGIIFAVWFSLALFILIDEDLKGMEALLKSREYVKGIWSGVFWRFVFGGGLYAITFFILEKIFGLLEIPYAGLIILFINGLFLIPLLMSYSFLVYRNVKALKGEIAFESASGKKAAFLFVGILGILFTLLGVLLAVFLALRSPVGKMPPAGRPVNIRQIR